MTNVGLVKLLLSTGGIRGFGAIGSVALIVTLSHNNTADVVGEFGKFLAGAIGLSLIIRLGMDAAIIKTGGRLYGEANFEELSSLRAFCMRLWLMSSLVLAAIGAAASVFFEPHHALEPLLASLPLALLLSLTLINGSLLRAIQKPRLASLFDLGITQGATAILLLAGLSLGLPSGNLFNIGFLYCSAIALAIASTFALPKYFVLSPGKNILKKHADFSGTLPAFFVLNLASFVNQWGFIAIAGILLNDQEVASLLICYRVAALLSLIQSVSTAVMASRFAYYLAQEKLKLLRLEYKVATIAAAVAGIVLFMMIVALSELLLGLFASAHIEYKLSLCVIALGQVINVVTGACGAFLVVNGQHEVMRNIVIISGLLGLVLYFLLGSKAGVLGMAIANGIAVACQNLLAFVACRKAMRNLRNAPAHS